MTGVDVAVTTADGAAIEAGEAVETPADSGRWVYPLVGTCRTATAAVAIPLRGASRPGGLGEAAQEKAL